MKQTIAWTAYSVEEVSPGALPYMCTPVVDAAIRIAWMVRAECQGMEAGTKSWG